MKNKQRMDAAVLGGDLKQIPGIGANMEQHLQNIGIQCVFRCAVYYAEHEERDAEKCKWWYWKDKDYPERE